MEKEKCTTETTSTDPTPSKHALLSLIPLAPSTHCTSSISSIEIGSGSLLQARINTASPARSFLRSVPRYPSLRAICRRLIKAHTLATLRDQRLGLDFGLIGNRGVSAKERGRIAAGPAGPATRLERHPIALTDGRFVIALTITYLGVSRDHSWKRERFYVAFGWERRSAATRVAFAVLGGRHAIIARGRLVIADFKAGFLVGKAAGPARAGSGLEGDHSSFALRLLGEACFLAGCFSRCNGGEDGEWNYDFHLRGDVSYLYCS